MTFHYNYRLKGVSKKQDPPREAKGIAALSLLVISGFFILLVAFLIENDNLISKNYQLRDFEKRLSEQQALIKKLEIKQAEDNSLQNLEAAVKTFNLVTVDKAVYLEAAQAAMALSGSFAQ